MDGDTGSMWTRVSRDLHWGGGPMETGRRRQPSGSAGEWWGGGSTLELSAPLPSLLPPRLTPYLNPFQGCLRNTNFSGRLLPQMPRAQLGGRQACLWEAHGGQGRLILIAPSCLPQVTISHPRTSIRSGASPMEFGSCRRIEDLGLLTLIERGRGAHSLRGSTHRFAIEPNGTLKEERGHVSRQQRRFPAKEAARAVVKGTGSGLQVGVQVSA